MKHHSTFYANNPNYLKTECEDTCPPILEPPPVENLWSLYGINLPTEVSYYFKPHKTDESRYVLDPDSDVFSNQKIGRINPRGLSIVGGIGYETKDTFQASARVNKSGDGTVPYCSLSYATYWEQLAKTTDIPLKHVKTIEIDAAEHREMLSNQAVIRAILHLVCTKPIAG